MKNVLQFLSIKFLSLIGIILSITMVSCDKGEEINPDIKQSFLVTIENVSNNSTLPEGALPDRTVPLSHGVWATYETWNLFVVDMLASEGTQRLAEDCFTTVKLEELSKANYVINHGEFTAPGGPFNDPAIFAGESSQFVVTASPGQKLQIISMFVQSNDWFYSFSKGGLELFEGNKPISGDVTSELFLYDAGTEADEPLGMGSTQKLDQDPKEINVGPVDPVNRVKLAVTKHPDYFIPPTSSVIRVTISPQIVE